MNHDGQGKPANHPAGPCLMVIFGASGDLTKRKLIPAICNLAAANLLPARFAIVGFAFDPLTTETFRQQLDEEIKTFATSPIDPQFWQSLMERTSYIQGDFKDPAAFERLKQQIDKVEQDYKTEGNRFFYLATAPAFFSEIIQQLSNAGLAQQQPGHWTRFIIEKPFGHDLESARKLNAEIRTVLSESQIYRIDHYLGKETVQNIMVFRFGNSIFEPIWNRSFIDHVQVTAAESIGVEHRGAYYEHAGALRDMVPNHLFQLVSLTAMEPPVSFEADAVRQKHAEVLQSIQPWSPEDVLQNVVRGQYGQGVDGAQAVTAYRNEPSVSSSSATETFVAMKLLIDNWRWAGVPFYLRTGKRLAKQATEIAIQFRRTPFVLFRNTPIRELQPNRLLIRIQPEEGISLRFGAKVPGPVMTLGLVNMDFDYKRYFGSAPNTGYERLLYDCMIGDATLFKRTDSVETAWKVLQPVLDVWSALPPRDFPNYAACSWGPPKADELLARDGREWRELE
jgi:glucose-6-phosphate 1-dehydrogenase